MKLGGEGTGKKAVFPKRDRDFVRDLSSLNSPHEGLVVFVSREYFEPNEPIEKIYRDKELIIKKMRVKS